MSSDLKRAVEMVLCRDDEDACPHCKVIRRVLNETSPAPIAEVRLNDDGTLDEVVCRGDQLEQMDFNHWFLSMGDVAVWLHAKGKITASYEHRSNAALDAGKPE